ncbi:MAG: hypothetical protein OEV44_09260 [Spirochaetota bacterium]|nr:hypothetical protein [Spirochaetota bacterium]
MENRYYTVIGGDSLAYVPVNRGICRLNNHHSTYTTWIKSRIP